MGIASSVLGDRIYLCAELNTGKFGAIATDLTLKISQTAARCWAIELNQVPCPFETELLSETL